MFLAEYLVLLRKRMEIRKMCLVKHDLQIQILSMNDLENIRKGKKILSIPWHPNKSDKKN